MNEPAHLILESRVQCRDALRTALAEAAAAGCREMWWCDLDYADWPLSDKGVLESLEAWAYSHRRLTVLAHSFETLPRQHARWVEWRRRWSHVVECRALEELESGQVPRLLLAPGVVTVRIFDAVHHRGSVSHSLDDALRCKEIVDAVSQRSVEAFPATVLGL